jgi:small subunit ribosomal protein S9
MDQDTVSASEQDMSTATGAEAPVLDIGSQPEEYERSTGTMRGRVDRTGAALGTGRRKTAVARVRIRDGKGTITVNGRDLNAFFPLERDQQMILAPLKATGMQKSVDVWVRVVGGGPTGQTGAVVLGIARALQAKNPESHHLLSDGGFLTRDGRMVERKKYGRKKARRSFQFSKR